MTLWVLKGGRHGEREEKMLNQNVLAMGWEELPDLSNVKSKEELQRLIESVQPDSSKHSVANQTGQLWAFIKTARVGDVIVVPLKTTSKIAIGEITGGYNYTTLFGPNMLHTRPVKWIKKDLPRSTFDQDLLYTFGSAMTFCRAERNHAEQRVNDIIAGKPSEEKIANDVATESDSDKDLEEITKYQITDLIERKFKGHDMANLIGAIIRAQGFNVQISPPGPDGGVDVLASSGVFGFQEPRICVQVKSGDSAVDATILRDLNGTMVRFQATHGILVAWGGFKDSVRKDHKTDSFRIQLWDSDRVVEELLKNYEKLDPVTKAQIPLKRTWIVARTELEE